MTQYTLLSCIESKIIDSKQLYGRFVLGNFSKGQALTMANALRRSLLSQLIGVAIYFVEIKGVVHEYETIKGVHECVLDLLLNLRQVILKSDIELFNTQLCYVNVKGPGIVRARDLKLPNFLSIVDPNQYIATLSPKGRLTLKLLIGCGKTYLTHDPSSFAYEKQITKLKQRSWFDIGYVFSGKPQRSNQWYRERNGLQDSEILPETLQWNKQQQRNLINQQQIEQQLINKPIEKPIEKSVETLVNLNESVEQKETAKNPLNIKHGYFPIDAIFAPVLKVNYTIETVHKTKEKIYLEIWTNGSIDPRNAIHKTAKALIKLFLPLQITQINPLPNDQKTVGMSSIVDQKKIKNPLTRFKKRLKFQNQKFSTKKTDFEPRSFCYTIKKVHQFQKRQKFNNFQKQFKVATIVNSLNFVKHKKTLLETQTSITFLKNYLKSNPHQIGTILKGILRPKKSTVDFRFGWSDSINQIHSVPNQSLVQNFFDQSNPKNFVEEKNFVFKSHSATKFGTMVPDLPLKQQPFNENQNPMFVKKANVIKKNMMQVKLQEQINALKAEKKLTQNKEAMAQIKKEINQKTKEIAQNEEKLVQIKKQLQQGFRDFKAEILTVELNQLQLPTQIYFRLKTHQIHTIAQLIQTSKQQLYEIIKLDKPEFLHVQVTLKHFICNHLI